jgi:hypothetical protein
VTPINIGPPPEHTHTPTCWLTNNPACVKWRIETLERENGLLAGRVHHLLAKDARAQIEIREIKGMLDRIDATIERELKK